MNETDLHAPDLSHRPVRRRPLILAALAPLAVVSGCATAIPATTPAATEIAAKIAVPASVPTKELASLTLNVGDQKAGLQALLTAAGELADVPYNIKWSTFTSGPPLLEAVNAGAVDVGGGRQHPTDLQRGSRGKDRHHLGRARLGRR